MLTHGELLELKRWNTPSVYNGWEQITGRNSNKECFNLEETRDFMPHMGPMVGYAVTLQIEPANSAHKNKGAEAWSAYRKYVSSIPGPKIAVVQDLDKPMVYGSFWGEVNANFHKALGCVGVIVDGAIRDLDEMNNAGFKAIARRLCIGHASCTPVRWNCEVEVFGCPVRPGQLIHADKHGFLAIPEGEESGLLDAVRFMDSNECNTMIAAARSCHGLKQDEVLRALDASMQKFGENAKDKFGKKGEW
ncbi:MAG: RraA family protein [Cyclobacteriaceae bacterium]|nr:RraA family protein [Cyclobacteriaceae bacterium]